MGTGSGANGQGLLDTDRLVDCDLAALADRDHLLWIGFGDGFLERVVDCFVITDQEPFRRRFPAGPEGSEGNGSCDQCRPAEDESAGCRAGNEVLLKYFAHFPGTRRTPC